MRSEPVAAADEGLNEHQQRHLLVSCQYIDKLLGTIEQLVAASSSRPLFPRHTSTLTALQKKVLSDYLARIRDRLLHVLDSQDLRPPPPHGQDVFAIHSTLIFVDNAIEELKPKYMRGFGAVPDALVPVIDGIVDELRAIVQKLNEYLAEDPSHDLQARLARLERGHDDVDSLALLERIITARGLVEYRPRLTVLVERASSRTFEIAVFGRVSSGKSSLLNHVLETPVLPVGVTPITSVPTRITYGKEPTLRVWFADRPAVTLALDRLPEFVTGQENPSNARHVLRLVVELPARRLREGVVFVDTPGLRSLARGGAEQTMAYLPRCDMGAVLIDAGSTLTPDDLLTVQALYEAAVPATILLSKADLLAEGERQRTIAYICDQLRRELNVEMAVHPVSVVPGHDTLVDLWFSAEIEPLYGRHQEAARLSLGRKIAALREAVQTSLKVRLDRRDRARHLDAAAVKEAESELRRTAGLFTPAVGRCEQLAQGLTSLGGEILHQAARRLRRDGRSGQGDSQVVVDEISASIRDVAGDRIERIRLEVDGLSTGGARAVERASKALGLRAEPPRPEIDDVPQLALVITGFTIPHTSLLAFSGALQAHYVESQLRRHIGVRLDGSLTAHARLMEAWARRAIEAARAAFEQQAEPLRTSFERLRRPATDLTRADEAAGLATDLQQLEQLTASHAPQA